MYIYIYIYTYTHTYIRIHIHNACILAHVNRAAPRKQAVEDTEIEMQTILGQIRDTQKQIELEQQQQEVLYCVCVRMYI
jgi:hypothetical protein